MVSLTNDETDYKRRIEGVGIMNVGAKHGWDDEELKQREKVK